MLDIVIVIRKGSLAFLRIFHQSGKSDQHPPKYSHGCSANSEEKDLSLNENPQPWLTRMLTLQRTPSPRPLKYRRRFGEHATLEHWPLPVLSFRCEPTLGTPRHEDFLNTPNRWNDSPAHYVLPQGRPRNPARSRNAVNSQRC